MTHKVKTTTRPSLLLPIYHFIPTLTTSAKPCILDTETVHYELLFLYLQFIITIKSMANEVVAAIKALAEEKGLSYESVLETLQTALGAAYRKDFGNKQQNIEVIFDPESGDMQVFDVKTVVPDMDIEKLAELAKQEAEERNAAIERGEEPAEPDPNRPRFNPKTDMMLADATEQKADAAIGDEIRMQLEVPSAFGRMAAQTAKQVIMQKIREAERGQVFAEFEGRSGEIVMGTVQRRDGRNVIVDLGKGTALMLASGQVRSERYEPGMRYKFLLEKVEMGMRGPEILVSRASADFVLRIFETEIPEITSGLVEIKGVAREAGARSKVAVWTDDDSIDPVGACIGQRGTRIQTIIHELGGEKIDIIQFEDDPEEYIQQALSPAKVLRVDMAADQTTEDGEVIKVAEALVAEDQFSLAIGKGGQNVRLAAQLTGYKINVNHDGPEAPEESEETEAPAEEENAEDDSPTEEPQEETQEGVTEPAEAAPEAVSESAETPEEAEEDIANDES